jgi:hypothetical protein
MLQPWVSLRKINPIRGFSPGPSFITRNPHFFSAGQSAEGRVGCRKAPPPASGMGEIAALAKLRPAPSSIFDKISKLLPPKQKQLFFLPFKWHTL